MRIYQINFEHKKWGLNWSSKKVAAKSFEDALQKGKKTLKSNEKIEGVELLETTEE